MAVERVRAPTGGLAPPSAISAVPKDKAFVIENFRVDQPGKLRLRGPFGTAKTIWGSSKTSTGIWTFGEKFLTTETSGGGAGTAQHYDTITDTVTSVTLTDAGRCLNGRSARLGSYAYGPSFDPSSALLRWNGNTVEPIVQTHAPRGAADVVTHLERIFAAGGSAPGTSTPVKPNSIWWSDVGGPVRTLAGATGVAATDVLTRTAHGLSVDSGVTITALTGGAGLTVGQRYFVIAAGLTADNFQISATQGGAAVNFTTDITAANFDVDDLKSWQDDVSGLTNQIPVGDDGDAIVGLASLGQQLLVFKNNSIWVILGSAPSNFTVRKLVGTMGCVDKRSICVIDDAVVFVNKSGSPMLYDGAALERLEGLPYQVNVPTASAVRMPNDHILTQIGSQFSLLYLPTRAWTSVTAPTTVFSAATGRLVSTELGAPYVFDNLAARPLADITRSTSQVTSDLDISGGVSRVIAGKVWFRLLELGQPFLKAVLRRVAMSYIASPGTPAWTLNLQDLTLTDIVTPQVFSDVGVITALKDLYVEVTTVILILTYTPTGTPAATVELNDLWVEYELAQQR